MWTIRRRRSRVLIVDNHVHIYNLGGGKQNQCGQKVARVLNTLNERRYWMIIAPILFSPYVLTGEWLRSLWILAHLRPSKWNWDPRGTKILCPQGNLTLMWIWYHILEREGLAEPRWLVKGPQQPINAVQKPLSTIKVFQSDTRHVESQDNT